MKAKTAMRVSNISTKLFNGCWKVLHKLNPNISEKFVWYSFPFFKLAAWGLRFEVMCWRYVKDE